MSTGCVAITVVFMVLLVVASRFFWCKALAIGREEGHTEGRREAVRYLDTRGMAEGRASWIQAAAELRASK